MEDFEKLFAELEALTSTLKTNNEETLKKLQEKKS